MRQGAVPQSAQVPIPFGRHSGGSQWQVIAALERGSKHTWLSSMPTAYCVISFPH